MFSARSSAAQGLAAALQQQLTSFGLKVGRIPLPRSVIFGRMKAKEPGGIILYSYRMRPDWDGRSSLHSEGVQNVAGLKDKALDELLDEVEREMNPVAWKRRMADVRSTYRAQLPSIPLLLARDVSVRRKDLKNWRPTGGLTPVTWNAEQWLLEKAQPRGYAEPAASSAQ